MRYVPIKYSFAGALALVLVITLFPMRTRAAGDTNGAEVTVRGLLASMKSLAKAKTPEQRAEIIARVNRVLALGRLARESLGAQWDKLDGKQREHFVSLFSRAIQKLAYPRASRALNKFKVTYLADEVTSTTTIVKTTVARSDGGKIGVNYVLTNDQGKRKVIDVILDGESLSKTVRGRIQQALKVEGFDKLVADLERHVKNTNPALANNGR